MSDDMPAITKTQEKLYSVELLDGSVHSVRFESVYDISMGILGARIDEESGYLKMDARTYERASDFFKDVARFREI